MALPPIIFTSQEVTLYSPCDPAIDRKKTTEKRLESYSDTTDLDVSTLILNGESPTKFIVRALSPAQNDVIGCLVYGDGLDESDNRNTAVSLGVVEVMLHSIRFGLVRVEGFPGWEDGAKRGPINGSVDDGWTEDTVGSIDSETRLFLGRAILSLSRMDQKKTNDNANRSPIELEQGGKVKKRKKRAEAVRL